MNIWTGLLFLEGAIADPALARELAGDDAPGAKPAEREPAPRDLPHPRATGRIEPQY